MSPQRQSETGFNPAWASSPGETISEILAENEISIAEFAQRLDQPIEMVVDLLDGRLAISIETARKLEAALGASRQFWLNRDFQYRQRAELLNNNDRAWLDSLPVGDIVKFGWLPRPPKPEFETEAMLDFFGVPDISTWQAKYAHLQSLTAFRTSPTFESRPGAVAAWLRFGEKEAEGIECDPWSRKSFLSTLKEIRALTRESDPKIFLPKLHRACATCGVAVVVARTPTGCRASGATLFTSDRKALLMLSFRYLTDDHFWFTFFHEAGHLVLHAPSDIYVEGMEDAASDKEAEANHFAAETLLPRELQDELPNLKPTLQTIVRFARRAGIAPGIVVGQLQHRGLLRRNQLNNVKRRYEWSNAEFVQPRKR